MFNKFGQQILKCLVLTITVFLFFTIAHASVGVSSSQEVYLAEEPLPEIAARLENLENIESLDIGRSPKEIVASLKKTLRQITPELAQERFGIRWLDNDLRQDDLKSMLRTISNDLGGKKPLAWPIVYPPVAICYMGPEVGYGLFAMANIQRGAVIVEYTGKHIKKKGLTPRNSYDAIAYIEGKNSFEKIAAEHEGNAARFAQHLLSRDDLSLYGYKFFDKTMSKRVAMSNSALVLVADSNDNRHVVLMATEDIKMFEQIGFYYDDRYGYELSEWPQEPCLFDKAGDIISREKYQILHKRVMFFDSSINHHAFLSFQSEDELKSFAGSNSVINIKDHMAIAAKDTYFYVALKEWEEQMAKPRNRLTVPGRFISASDLLAEVLADDDQLEDNNKEL